MSAESPVVRVAQHINEDGRPGGWYAITPEVTGSPDPADDGCLLIGHSRNDVLRQVEEHASRQGWHQYVVAVQVTMNPVERA